ncbi:unnamed protein product [Rotaria sp. Silwood2]|nr:unnamed protein product [Rotaria sp. Silwood2]CAF3357161.1 unnamed protein product [Rotaria sp. Silwood2]CAF4298778.1 unnamed protein product [Rotaria sp. Silwood2]CAF4375274.1 unnamed protein product [Rotaria sp. Silwood2]
MNQIKRKLSFNQSSKEQTKKLRNKFDRKITSIENLSNEFFYEIFDYLDGCEIYQTFSNLNHRFQQLLNSSSLRFKINFHHSTSIEIFMNNYKQIILLNKDQIFSIHLSLSTHNNQIISSLNIDSSFNRLESRVLQSGPGPGTGTGTGTKILRFTGTGTGPGPKFCFLPGPGRD